MFWGHLWSSRQQAKKSSPCLVSVLLKLLPSWRCPSLPTPPSYVHAALLPGYQHYQQPRWWETAQTRISNSLETHWQRFFYRQHNRFVSVPTKSNFTSFSIRLWKGSGWQWSSAWKSWQLHVWSLCPLQWCSVGIPQRTTDRGQHKAICNTTYWPPSSWRNMSWPMSIWEAEKATELPSIISP